MKSPTYAEMCAAGCKEIISHTPGPWHVATVILPILKPHEALAVWDEDHQVLPDSINGRPICILSPLEQLSQEDMANAALIAAAPDLLALASSIQAALAYPRGSEAQIRCIEEIGQDARQIAAKAQGKP